MKNRHIIITLHLGAILCCISCKTGGDANYTCGRAPLHQNEFIGLPLGAISAEGWLLSTLERQRDGLTGHLDEYYPEVMGPRNGWLGGDGDQWERGPYWIDGLLPLAYILKDQALIDKTTPWIEWILSSARPDGYFGPDRDYPYEEGLQRDNCADWWPRMVVLKVLQQYYEATDDRRVIDLMTGYFRYQLANLKDKPLDHWTFWARFRGGDNLMCVYWLYNITGDRFLLDLGKLLYSQTEPYTEQFLGRDRLSRVGTIHGVNLAQGIKTPIVYWQYDNDDKYIRAIDCALEDLRRFHGFPNGMFSVDEQLHGNDPTQGIELCAIVEYMFSLETMYKISGNPRFADLLERIAFNALPAHTTEDYMTRQYFQQVNQIRASVHPNNFDCNHGGTDNCFGLLTGYPCCTSNMHQGWPKFVQNLWYATVDGGLAVAMYGPSSVVAKVADGVEARFSEKTRYPFETTVEFCLESISEPASFPLRLRIPQWCGRWELSLNGKPLQASTDRNGMVTVERVWKQGDTVLMEFVPEVRLSVWKENSRAVERGPLVYALDIKHERTVTGDVGKDGFYEYASLSGWNYALIQCADSLLQTRYRVDFSGLGNADGFPWTSAGAPLRIRTEAVKANDWKEYNGNAGPLPYSLGYGMNVSSQRYEVELIPYGCTTLRITQFPMSGNHNPDNYEPIRNDF